MVDHGSRDGSRLHDERVDPAIPRPVLGHAFVHDPAVHLVEPLGARVDRELRQRKLASS